MRRLTAIVAAVTAAGWATAPATAQQAEPALDLSASASRIVYGDAVTLSGTVTATEHACRAGADVTIEVDVADDMPDVWEPVAHAHTEDDGTFDAVVLPQNTGAYRARVEDEPGGCAAATSNEVGVAVRVAVELKAASRTVERGTRARLTVRVEPLCRREATRRLVVRLFRFRNGRFVEVEGRRMPGSCEVTFEPRVRRTSVFQARFPRIDGLHWSYLPGRSPLEVVGVKR